MNSRIVVGNNVMMNGFVDDGGAAVSK